MKSYLVFCLLLFISVELNGANTHNEIVNSISVSSDSKKIASITKKQVKIWDVESGKLLNKYDFGGTYIKLMLDNKTFMVVSDTAKLIDIETGVVKRRFFSAEHQLKGVSAVSNNCKYLVCTTTKSQLLVFDIETGNVISPQLKVSPGDYSFVRCVTFSSDDKTILVTESSDKSYMLISVPDFSFKRVDLNVTALSINQSSKFFLIGYVYGFSGSNNFTAKYLNTGTEMHYEEKHSVQSMAFHPKNLNMVANGTLYGLMVWDVEKGKSKKLKGHKMQINDVEFSSDGKYLFSASGDLNPDLQDYTVRMWDVEKMKMIRIFEEQ